MQSQDIDVLETKPFKKGAPVSDTKPRFTEEQIKATVKWLEEHSVECHRGKEGLVATSRIEIVTGDRVYLPALAEVSDTVYVYRGATFEAPSLTATGSVDVSRGATFKAPALTTSGLVDVSRGATLEAPALTEVSGPLYVQEGAAFEAPSLTAVYGTVCVYRGATFEAPALRTAAHLIYATELCGHKVEVFDYIGTVTQGSKVLDGITVRKCRRASFKDGVLVGDRMYVVSRGEHHAHGETAKEAITDLMFKEADKDESIYRGMSPDTEKTVEDWIVAYRVVTGACRLGVREFIERLTKHRGELKESYTLSELLEMTQGEYGSERFREVVAA
ncbi:MAG: hypothetical protein AAGI37_21015 [Planctomycetota bacterium]